MWGWPTTDQLGHGLLFRVARDLAGIGGVYLLLVMVYRVFGTGTPDDDMRLTLVTGALLVVAALVDRLRHRGRPAAPKPDARSDLAWALSCLVFMGGYSVARAVGSRDVGWLESMGSWLIVVAFVSVAAEVAISLASGVRRLGARLVGNRARAAVMAPLAVGFLGFLAADLALAAASSCPPFGAAGCVRDFGDPTVVGWFGWLIGAAMTSGAAGLWATGEVTGGQWVAALAYVPVVAWFSMALEQLVRDGLTPGAALFIVPALASILALLGAIVAMALVAPTDAKPAPVPAPAAPSPADPAPTPAKG
jgi:hypothetical protein